MSVYLEPRVVTRRQCFGFHCSQAKIPCGSMCKCVGCKNYQESSEKKSLMNLADAAEVRTIQQNSVRSKFSQLQDTSAGAPTR